FGPGTFLMESASVTRSTGPLCPEVSGSAILGIRSDTLGRPASHSTRFRRTLHCYRPPLLRAIAASLVLPQDRQSTAEGGGENLRLRSIAPNVPPCTATKMTVSSSNLASS